ncbi:hypothetical protein [Bacillus sp. FJAT-22090]|uniref:hypothetical protein n=1 Tax=Bacillus sp. FJAT-22090 TaxID=1581038 RepID=UPI0011A95846|nr:hypothetical protein [Bacillus sp. FJAT-22090]
MQNLVEVYQKATQQLQQVVSQTPERIKVLNEIISRADLEVQDLLHLAELDTFNAAEGYHIANQIKKARVKRRQAKDEMDMLSSIKAIINQNSKLEPHVQGIQKSISTHVGQKSRRTYTARVRTDLMVRFNKCNITKL